MNRTITHGDFVCLTVRGSTSQRDRFVSGVLTDWDVRTVVVTDTYGTTHRIPRDRIRRSPLANSLPDGAR